MSSQPIDLRRLARQAGTPRLRMLADLKGNIVVDVGIEWDDLPDVPERIKRITAIVELLNELKKGAAC